MAARPIILFGIAAAAAAGRRGVPAVTLAPAAGFLMLFLLVLNFLFKGYHFPNGVILLFVAPDVSTLAADSARLV